MPDTAPDPAVPLVLLHGGGQGPMAWQDVVVALHGSRRLLTPWVPGLCPTDPRPLSIPDAAAALDDQLTLEGARQVDVVGLSYGAIVAAQLAADHPARVRRLVLSGGQVRPAGLMAVQSALVRLVPAARLASTGVSKQRLLAALDVARRTDLSAALPRIRAVTLVVVGGRDRANQPAARWLASGIPGARLHVVAGGGHLLNTERPDEFAALVRDFVDGPGPAQESLGR